MDECNVLNKIKLLFVIIIKKLLKELKFNYNF